MKIPTIVICILGMEDLSEVIKKEQKLHKEEQIELDLMVIDLVEKNIDLVSMISEQSKVILEQEKTIMKLVKD